MSLFHQFPRLFRPFLVLIPPVFRIPKKHIRIPPTFCAVSCSVVLQSLLSPPSAFFAIRPILPILATVHGQRCVWLIKKTANKHRLSERLLGEAKVHVFNGGRKPPHLLHGRPDSLEPDGLLGAEGA